MSVPTADARRPVAPIRPRGARPGRPLLLSLAFVVLAVPGGHGEIVAPVPFAAAADATAPECWGLRMPVDGPVSRGFAPGPDGYSGHWGVDVAAVEDAVVRSPGDGVVTFAGTVVDIEAVTVDHGGGLRSTVSSLASIAVSVGQRVAVGDVLGTSGDHDGRPAVHLSMRVGRRYVDPLPAFVCRPSTGIAGLRLVPLPR